MRASPQELHFQATLSDIGDDGSFTITFVPTGSGTKKEIIAMAKQYATNLVAMLPTLNDVFALNNHAQAERILRTYQPVFRVSPEEGLMWEAQYRAREAIINGATWLTAVELGKKLAETKATQVPNRIVGKELANYLLSDGKALISTSLRHWERTNTLARRCWCFDGVR